MLFGLGVFADRSDSSGQFNLLRSSHLQSPTRGALSHGAATQAVSRFHSIAVLLPLCVCSLVSCGPSLKSTIDLPVIKVSPQKVSREERTANTYLYIDELIDARVEKTIIKRDHKEVLPSGDVAPVVVDALKQALGDKGFSFSESAPVIISGEVREWIADVSGSLPTKVNAQATIFIEILDPANKRIYSSVYKGFASLEEASIDEKDVKKTLATSMEQAVTQAAMDKQLVTVLSSF
ncbi:MAG: YajG family lipoprotein [Bdellovibrionota bacterium]